MTQPKTMLAGFLILVLAILALDLSFYKPKKPLIIRDEFGSMPIVIEDDPVITSIETSAPIAQRGPEYIKYLAASVKIAVSSSTGSGTIIYYDDKSGYAYVASCGHLWRGSRNAKDVKNVNATVITWYHNNTKLDKPRKYQAEVLFWSNVDGYDTSLLRFKPDWIPNYFPIAPAEFKIPSGIKLNSLGCDEGSEVARYEVETIGFVGDDLKTKYNSPRPGRSGGGLMSDDGYYVGTCWGTSNTKGTGVGYFTPIASIRKIWTANGYGWLLNIPLNNLARRIPIIYMNTTEKIPQEAIPLPRNAFKIY